MIEVFIARQPIYNRQIQLYGYELLYRSGDLTTVADHVDGEQATSQVFLASVLQIGLSKLVGGRTCFINITRDLLMLRELLAFRCVDVYLEILEDVEIDVQLIESIRRLKQSGYGIVLDDFSFNDQYIPLLKLADLVKLDALALSHDELRRHVEMLKPFSVKLVAEKVEDARTYQFCRDLGFDFFQGNYFEKPRIVKGRRIPVSHMAAMRVLSALQDSKVTGKKIEEILRPDVGLTFKLMKLVNSSLFSLPNKISSIGHAATLLGHARLKILAMAVILSRFDDKPAGVVISSMVRARMCEAIAGVLSPELSNSAFTVGLFSLLDVILDASMEEILFGLPLTDEITRALLSLEGELGQVLGTVLAYETADRDKLAGVPISTVDMVQIYIDAVEWADGLVKILYP